MKKKAAAIFLAVLITLSTTACAGVGLKGGLNFTKWTGDDIDSGELDWKMGYKIGAALTFPTTTIFTVQPEIYFTTKGWKAEEVLSGEVVTYTTSMNYIEIPLLLKLNMDTGMNYKPAIFGGPYIGFLLGNPTLKVEVGGDSAEEDYPDDIFNSTDIGGVVGAGVDFELGMNTASLEARFNFGLTSISESDGEDIKNMGFSIMGGFSF
ncbi:MAG TPA: porin family protein [Candidatus Krumholzibacteriaceae bacterium]|nr:porin family protein [Candidatus Krumholzibacteriaceae bacterium]